jgi:hypothetical protein
MPQMTNEKTMMIRNAPQRMRDWISLWNFEIIMVIGVSLSLLV